ncbi:MAG: class I SAM-dependent methyltransferase [Nanoarchaeota archaeon]|nr:class I SAM-dependent methyltransferase [Nanoarchaeota archaeon]
MTDENKVGLWKEIETNPTESYKEYFEVETNFLKKKSNKNLAFLDIGCGDGRTLKNVGTFFKIAYGIDYNKKAVENAKKNLSGVENVEILFEDARAMDFENESIDIIFIGLTFSNFTDEIIPPILNEIKRVLKDSGKFIFSCYNENSFEERWAFYKRLSPNEIEVVDRDKAYVKSRTSNEISRGFSEKELRNVVNEFGFKVVEFIRGRIFNLMEAKKK